MVSYFLNVSHLLHLNFFYIGKTPLLFPFLFVGLHNLSVKQNRNCLLAASVPPPGNKPPSSGWVCQPYTAVMAGHLPHLLSPVSPSAFLGPPFPSSSFLYYSSRLPSQRLKSSSHEVLFPFL